MQKYLNIIYIAILSGIAIFSIKLQMTSRLVNIQEAFNNQSQVVASLRSDINSIAEFLNNNTK